MLTLLCVVVNDVHVLHRYSEQAADDVREKGQDLPLQMVSKR